MDFKLQADGSTVLMSLTGEINESSDFSRVNIDEYTDVVIDFQDIVGINSCGVREWINFLKTIASKNVSYVNCPKIIVDQMNMINNFIGLNFQVISIELPYYCDDCDDEFQKVFNLDDIINGGQIEIPTIKCDDCGHDMEFDEIPEQYFSFLKQVTKK